MADNDRPDPMDILRQLVNVIAGGGDPRQAAQDVWARATETKAKAEPSAAQQRENLSFALATRAVEALEDIALNTAAIRQRLERNAGAERVEFVRPDLTGERPDGLFND